MTATQSSTTPFHFGIALKSTGYHPASTKNEAQRQQIFEPNSWAELTRSAQRAGAVYVTYEDSFEYQDLGQFDASLLAAWVAPRTQNIGLIPTITVTHTEPFHVQKNIATLDHISSGWAGWQVAVSDSAAATELLGRGRADLDIKPLYTEAIDVVDVSRRLWDSWEDDAEIRDVATGRFIDRNKLHYVDFVGPRFSIKGPTITPRSPQGQPVVAFAGRDQAVLDAAVHTGDVLFVPVHNLDDAQALLTQIRELETQLGRAGAPLLVHADLPVLVTETEAAGQHRWEELNGINPAWLNADQLRGSGAATSIATLVAGLKSLGFNGVRLQPADNAVDVAAVETLLAPRLRDAEVLTQPAPQGSTLRGALGLERPNSRYTNASTVEHETQGATV